VLAAHTPSTLAAFTATSMAAALITYALYVHAVLEKYPWLAHALRDVRPFRYPAWCETRGLGEKPEDVVFQDRPLPGLPAVCGGGAGRAHVG
jgi:hypothetical protein